MTENEAAKRLLTGKSCIYCLFGSNNGHSHQCTDYQKKIGAKYNTCMHWMLRDYLISHPSNGRIYTKNIFDNLEVSTE